MIFFLATIRDNLRLENLVFVEKVGDFFQGSIRSFSFEGRKSFLESIRNLFFWLKKYFRIEFYLAGCPRLVLKTGDKKCFVWKIVFFFWRKCKKFFFRLKNFFGCEALFDWVFQVLQFRVFAHQILLIKDMI